MTAVIERIELTEQMLADAAAWYDRHPYPEAFARLHPLALREVRRLSGGDLRRCVVDEDGSVLVVNYRAW